MDLQFWQKAWAILMDNPVHMIGLVIITVTLGWALRGILIKERMAVKGAPVAGARRSRSIAGAGFTVGEQERRVYEIA
jgi:hypothetical protein